MVIDVNGTINQPSLTVVEYKIFVTVQGFTQTDDKRFSIANIFKASGLIWMLIKCQIVCHLKYL